MTKKIFFLLMYLFWVAHSLIAQNILFQKTYGCSAGAGSDWGRSLQQTSDGGYVLAGYSDGFGNGLNNYYLIKVNSNGDTLWTKVYKDVNNEDDCYSILQTSDGGFILAGTAGSANSEKPLLVKTNSDGMLQWLRYYPNTNWYYASSIDKTLDGGYIIGGSFEVSVSPSNWDAYWLKINFIGDTLWSKIYGSTGVEAIYSIHQDLDSGFIMAGI